MQQPHEQQQSESHSGRHALVLRPLRIALGYSGNLLLCISGSLLPLTGAQATLSYQCSGTDTQVCSMSADTPLGTPLTISDPWRPQQITITASFVIDGAAGPTAIQSIDLGDYGEATIGGEPLNGIMVVSQGTHGSDGDTQSNRDGGVAQGAMLTSSGSVVLNLAGTTASGMVVGVGVSSVGGDGFDQPSDHNNGGNGGNGGSTTLVNSSAVTISGGTLNSGVAGALVESRGGNGGEDNSAVIDYYGGNGGSTPNIEMDNYAKIALGSSSAYLQGGARAWGVAAQTVGGDGATEAKGQLPAGQGGSAGNVRFTGRGDVDVFLSSVTDTPDGIVGMLARSLGGRGGSTNYTQDNGGNGGNAGSITFTAGDSSLAQATNINVRANLPVAGTKLGTSAGILAQSIGGDGGTQNSNGAAGGNGGRAGDVGVDLYWVNLETAGDNVAGVMAYSRGGLGGSDNMSSYRTDGGNGGTAGNASVTLTSKGSQTGQQTSIATSGVEAFGVSAQSIGGVGGGAVDNAGAGQNGATAQITADENSIVSTDGGYSIGMLAQSVGGGGGTGEDFASGIAGTAGNGGNGGSGAEATIQSSGTVTTQGQYAHAILAQSIGGGGGAGAAAESIVALGGSGGSGGSGGTIKVTNAGGVTTNGYGSIGMIGQSIGGGGGAAGSASGLFAIGGSSNSQNNGGGSVTVSNTGAVSTNGAAAIGLLGQSIGGGGGSAASAAGLLSIGGSGGSGGNGSDVTVNADGIQQTSGSYAYGAVAQSIGGGGGNGGDAFGITTAAPIPTIGGSAGVGGSGGSVTMTANNSARVSTVGDGATALLAQSIGGGGGSGGSATQLSLANAVSLAIGGSGGSGGSAGTLNIQTSGATISTNGASAAGIIAQSIGGGGGSGGAAQALDVNVGFSLGVAVGGSGGSGGSADKVILALDNTQITTAGLVFGQPPAGWPTQAVDQTDSYGLLAQSIGGGGGNGGSAAARSIALEAPLPDDTSFAIGTAMAIGASGGAGGNGQEVDVSLSGSSAIQTAGQGSHGILAQSIGGGGGNGGDSKAMSRTVTIEDTSVAVNVDVAVGGHGGGKRRRCAGQSATQ